jgi:hypothetical protein
MDSDRKYAMSNQSRSVLHEADIGSGEKTAADHETEKLIEEVGKDKKNADAKRGVKEGNLKQEPATQQNYSVAQKH